MTPAFFTQNVLLWAVRQEEAKLIESWKMENSYEEALKIMFWSSKNKSKMYEFEYEGVVYLFTYKELEEGLQATYFAYAISNSSAWAVQPKILIGDSPDIILVFDDARIGLEVTEKYDFYNHDKPHIMLSAEQEIKDLWDKKGYMSYGMETDLLVPYKRNAKFNLDELILEVFKYKWSFHRIIIWVFSSDSNTWTYYTINLKSRSLSNVRTICLLTDKNYLY